MGGDQSAVIPRWAPVTLCSLFAILWSITALPHTLIVQYLCLVLGALVSIYIVKKNTFIFKGREVIPLLILAALFLWLVFHLFFVGQNFEMQLGELDSIWKRAFLGSIFAIGLGISLSCAARTRLLWLLIILGLAGPTFIFYFKYVVSQLLPFFGLPVPGPLMLYKSPAEFYIPKITYVFFCIPCFGVAVGALVSGLNQNLIRSREAIFYALLIALILGLFYLENIKNGIAYAAILLGIGALRIIASRHIKLPNKILICIFCIVLLAFFALKNIQENQSWKTFGPDLRVALSIDPFDPRGYILSGQYPLNENGVEVQPANYARFAWGIGALHLIRDNPWGYGLAQSSFGHLVKQRFPNTGLAQSHSGWLDLMLGIGIPGTALILLASILAIKNSLKLTYPLNILGFWFLGSSMLLWITTEVSQINYLNTFIWMIFFVASLGMGCNICNISNSISSAQR